MSSFVVCFFFFSSISMPLHSTCHPCLCTCLACHTKNDHRAHTPFCCWWNKQYCESLRLCWGETGKKQRQLYCRRNWKSELGQLAEVPPEPPCSVCSTEAALAFRGLKAQQRRFCFTGLSLPLFFALSIKSKFWKWLTPGKGNTGFFAWSRCFRLSADSDK